MCSPCVVPAGRRWPRWGPPASSVPGSVSVGARRATVPLWEQSPQQPARCHSCSDSGDVGNGGREASEPATLLVFVAACEREPARCMAPEAGSPATRSCGRPAPCPWLSRGGCGPALGAGASRKAPFPLCPAGFALRGARTMRGSCLRGERGQAPGQRGPRCEISRSRSNSEGGEAPGRCTLSVAPQPVLGGICTAVASSERGQPRWAGEQ